ncbi:MAG: glycosyl hydrolase [Promethearchaeota archaeon]|nr:MAG: glycosyl hydrolase [Candidatus Lokiarchaeota archaeon]
MSEKRSNEELSKLPFMDNNLDLEKRVEDLLGRLKLKEKFKLSSGTQFFLTKAIKRLGIPHFKMTDGPHGIGPHSSGDSVCTYFPVGVCRAATWNPELSEKFGVAVAQEVRDIGYHMLLGPGVNIQRAPHCGRNFEYQTEDPYLNSRLAVHCVKGIQSQRIAACVKHYACNNQETNRLTCNSVVSERALQEIYLPAFKATACEADAWSYMTCYNKVNGVYGSEHKNLLKERLMEEWGFRGFVVTDWGATQHIKTTETCVEAGLSLEMPTAIKYTYKNMRDALNKGKFTEQMLNENIRRLLRVMFLTGVFDDPSTIPPGSRNTSEHQAVARKIAEEGIVLLKNEDNFLPLDINSIKKIAVIGPNANKKMSRGGGSSQVKPPYEIKPIEGIQEKCKGKIEIVDTPSEADVVIYVSGLNHRPHKDSEGSDRKRFHLTTSLLNRINQAIQENPKIIVVLISGSPIGMDWIDKVPAVIEAWYPGMEGGHAIASVLFGDVNPSGKLPITFPKKLEDSPAQIVKDLEVNYDDGIFVGYRYFDTNNIEPLFPFGYGLSYTTFTYANLNINKEKMSENDTIIVSVDITNTGKRAGAEVVQLYVQDVECSVDRPQKELKGFEKVKLEPGEKKSVSLELKKEDLSFFDEKSNTWKAEKGIFNILIGSSSRDIRLEGKIEYVG